LEFENLRILNFQKFKSLPQRRFASVYDLVKPGGNRFSSLKVSEYMLGLLPQEVFNSLFLKDIDQKTCKQSPIVAVELKAIIA